MRRSQHFFPQSHYRLFSLDKRRFGSGQYAACGESHITVPLPHHGLIREPRARYLEALILENYELLKVHCGAGEYLV